MNDRHPVQCIIPPYMLERLARSANVRVRDQAIAGLVNDLDQRGLLDTTLFWVTSEFGRTPKVNGDSGRDHWARNYSMMLAGGGIARGVIHGASDSTGGEPARDAVLLAGLAANRPAHPLLGGGVDRVRQGLAPVQPVLHIVRKVASVAAVEKDPD